MSEISCSNCSGETQANCARNFSQTGQAIEEGVQQTIDGEWKQVTTGKDGEIIFTPLAPTSEGALIANALLRSMFVIGLKKSQTEIGCNLDDAEIEKKLITQGI